MGYGRLALVKFSIHLIIPKKGMVQFGDFFSHPEKYFRARIRRGLAVSVDMWRHAADTGTPLAPVKQSNHSHGKP